jgi:hypothetical protein
MFDDAGFGDPGEATERFVVAEMNKPVSERVDPDVGHEIAGGLAHGHEGVVAFWLERDRDERRPERPTSCVQYNLLQRHVLQHRGVVVELEGACSHAVMKPGPDLRPSLVGVPDRVGSDDPVSVGGRIHEDIEDTLWRCLQQTLVHGHRQRLPPAGLPHHFRTFFGNSPIMAEATVDG